MVGVSWCVVVLYVHAGNCMCAHTHASIFMYPGFTHRPEAKVLTKVHLEMLTAGRNILNTTKTGWQMKGNLAQLRGMRNG